MAMSSKRLVSMFGFCALITGCVNEPIGQRDASFGEAVKYNAAIQTISPDPIYPAGAAEPGGNADVGARAVKRYREGKVTPVEMMETTSGTTGPNSGLR
jgi:hypothetical protein